MTTKKELIKALRSNRKCFANIVYSKDNCGYFQIVKSDFLDAVLQMKDDVEFDVDINDKTIYIN